MKLYKKIFNKKIIICLLAFIIPILIMGGYTLYVDLTTNHSFFNNGENFLLADMASQYNALYNYMHDVFTGSESIFYSFSKGMGGNMASTIGYYLASPFNILYMFVSKIDTPFMTYIILLLKIGLCSLFMNLFMNYKYKPKISNLIFSVSYALMGFTTVYYFNNMWLDVVYMTPLVMIGISKLIEKNNCTFYIISLALAIIFNFYIAYMLCVFCVIYFIYELFCKYKLKEFKIYKKTILNFTLSSLLAAGISCIVLLPALTNLSHIMRFGIDENLLKIDVSQFRPRFFNEIFSKTFLGTHNETAVLGRNRPVIYVSLFNFLLMFMFFFNKKIRRKEKMLSLSVILFFMASFLIPHLQLFFQALSFPNGYIDRFSFLYIFFIIYLASKCFYNIDKIKLRYFILFILLYFLGSYYTSKIYLVFLDKSDIVFSCLFVFFYSILFFLFTRLKHKKIIGLILLLFVLIEVTINYIDTLITVKDLKVVSSYQTYYKESIDNLTNIENDFYRIDGDYYYSYLDSHSYGYNGITTALSTNDGDLYKFFYKNGGSLTYTTVMYDVNKLPILDSLFGVKYIHSKENLEKTLYDYYDKFKITKYNSFKKVYENKYVYLYKNPYALSLGYIIDDNYDKIYKKKSSNSLDSLNNLIKSLSGIKEDVLIPLEKEYLGNSTYKFNIDTNEDYIYLTVDYDISINWTVYDTVYINDEYVESLDSENIGTVKLENKYKNSEIILKLENSFKEEKDKADLYYLNMDAFKKAIDKLNNQELENVEVNKNKVVGEITANDDSTMMLSIPYEKGWNVYVDGKKTSYRKVAGDFIGIDLKKGTHKIELKYYSQNFHLGLVISLTSISLLGVYILKKRK